MQESFKINSSLSPYSVTIGTGLYSDIISKIKGNFVIICDESLVKSYGLDKLCSKIVSVVADENSKDLQNISSIINQVKQYGISRGDLLIGIGGGVIQDISCFVASIYMRGIDWIYFPTTFLGMCDSCIGGKSSINVSGIKNLVGNFYPPREIYVDADFVTSLNKEQIDAGLSEAVKICYASFDDKVLNQFFDTVSSLSEDKSSYANIISFSLKTKKWFIEVDEFDKKERQLLNFGHTFGHAIEGVGNYAIPHGIAVGFGMLWAIYFSSIHYNLANIESSKTKKLENFLLLMLKKYQNLRDIVNDMDVNLLLQKFSHDKKHSVSEYFCIIPSINGSLERVPMKKDDSFSEKFEESFVILRNKIS